MKNISKIVYTIEHKIAFLQTEKSLLGRITLRGIFHDMDKLIMLMLGMDAKKASKLHRKRSKHHEINGKIHNVQEAIIDWECARITKPDKPLNARDTFLQYYSHVPGVEKELEKLGL